MQFENKETNKNYITDFIAYLIIAIIATALCLIIFIKIDLIVKPTLPKNTLDNITVTNIENDEHIVRIDINSIDGQFVGVITIREILKNSISAPRIIDLIYKRNSVNIDKFRYELKSNGYTADETDNILTLLRLYTYYL